MQRTLGLTVEGRQVIKKWYSSRSCMKHDDDEDFKDDILYNENHDDHDQVAAIYPIAALLPHSCSPNTRAVYRRSGHKYFFFDNHDHWDHDQQVF